MRLAGLTIALALLSAGPGTAAPPKLIIVISVDQLSNDLFAAYRPPEQYQPRLTGGLARLAREGTHFRLGYQSHAATETCPGHSTLLTGRHPAATGIVANSWIDQRAARPDKRIYCAEDERLPGTSFTEYRVSPKHLRVRTLGDRLKAANRASRNVAIAGKDRAAVMMSGHDVDQRWYWDGKTFATDLRGVAEPRSIGALNRLFAEALARPSVPLVPSALCPWPAKPYSVAPGVTVGTGRLDRPAGDLRAVRAHPDFDAAVLAGAAALAAELGLGRGTATDMLSIGLSATDYVGHAFGSGGQEMCLQLLGLDRELGDFLIRMDQSGIDYAVVLSSDHGVMDFPERLRDLGVKNAARADSGLAAGEIGKIVAQQLGATKSVLLGDSVGGDLWLDRSLPPAVRRRALAAAIARYRAHPQVYGAWSAAEIARVRLPRGNPQQWTALQRVRASFDPARSGDLHVVLKPYVSPIAKPGAGYVATHGSVWDYDRGVPIIFWRKGMPASQRWEAVETVDIMPTLAALSGITIQPRAIDGRCLTGIVWITCP